MFPKLNTVHKIKFDKLSSLDIMLLTFRSRCNLSIKV